MTYLITPKSNTYDSLVPVNPDDWDIFIDNFTGKSLADNWVPVEVRFCIADKSGDFPSLMNHVPVFNIRAWQILKPLINASVEALPLKHSSEKLFAINVLELVDCLDYSQAKIERLPSGGIMFIDRYVFKKGCMEDKHIFKIREAPLMAPLVSNAFKILVEKNELKGLRFQKVA